MKSTSSLFAQLLQLIPQSAFRKIVREEHGERCAKKFTCKMQLVAMLYLPGNIMRFSGRRCHQFALRETRATVFRMSQLHHARVAHFMIATNPDYS